MAKAAVKCYASVALAAATGQDVHIKNIRAKRKKSGLLRQHLTAVKAAADCCGALCTQADGAELKLGAKDIIFRPGPLTGGDRHWSIGSGGSSTLVLQTVLPLMMAYHRQHASPNGAGSPQQTTSTVTTATIEGGTHVPFAPSAGYAQHALLPVLQRCGLNAEISTERTGFMQAGGGLLTARVSQVYPDNIKKLHLTETETPRSAAVIIHQNAVPEDVVDREFEHIRQTLAKIPWQLPTPTLHQRGNDAAGPGNYCEIHFFADQTSK